MYISKLPSWGKLSAKELCASIYRYYGDDSSQQW